MKQTIVIGLSALLSASSCVSLSALSNPTPIAEIFTANRSVSPVSKAKQNFYVSPRFGFRFVLPKGYILKPSDSSNTPLQVLEIWNQKDYQNRLNQTESPPIISITVYSNSKKLPLTTWKGPLSRNDERTLTVAGQRAIAYTSDGLYANDNVLLNSPDGRYVIRLQVGYLNERDRIRQVFQEIVKSFSFAAIASSNPPTRSGINYNQLQSLLAAGSWQAADEETRTILQTLAGSKGDLQYQSKEAIANLPCEDLRTIDNLWSAASKGHFGYSAQQRLWQQISTRTKNPITQVDRFGQAVGWLRSKPLPESHPLAIELGGTLWRLDTELNYTNAAPIGHFPWIGVSTSRLTELLQEQGCGSCTIDAMYLTSNRYYEYLPALFNRLKACPKN